MRSPFTREQRKRITEFYPELAAVAQKYHPNFTGQTTEIEDWNNQKAEDLLDKDLFKTLDTAKAPLKTWADRIRRIYINHLNNTIKKKANIKGAELKTHTFPLAILSGKISPCQLFIYENRDLIRTKYLDICAQTGKPGGGAKQQAVKMLWENTDQAKWKERAEEIENDISSNQAKFASQPCLAD